MSRGGGTVIILIASCFYVLASFYQLIRQQRYLQFIKTLAIYVAVAYLIYFGLLWSDSFDDGDTRIWVAVPFVILAMWFLLSGFILRSYVEKLLLKNVERSKPSIQLRIIGAILSLSGLTLWVYGIVYPLKGNTCIILLLLSLCCMIFGTLYLITGKSLNKMDS